MSFDLASIATEEAETPLPDIVNGDGRALISYRASIPFVDSLRELATPVLQLIADGLQTAFGLVTQISRKRAETALEKCARAATLTRYPWFTLAHIRDYLRFRTLLRQSSDFADVLRYFERLQDAGVISIVKIDVAKLARPGAFGWRMIATDIRIWPSGMLVEHYMTFGDMIEVNEAWLHKVYETWRSLSTDDMNMEQLQALERDARFSRHAYRELLFDGVLRDRPRGSTIAQDRKRLGGNVVDALLATLNLREDVG